MTLAQLKRDAKAGMSLELIERFGGCDETLRYIVETA